MYNIWCFLLSILDLGGTFDDLDGVDGGVGISTVRDCFTSSRICLLAETTHLLNTMFDNSLFLILICFFHDVYRLEEMMLPHLLWEASIFVL